MPNDGRGRAGGHVPGAAASSSNAPALARLARREAVAKAGLATPAIFLVGLGLAAPLAWLLWQSFLGPGGWTLEHYRVVFERPAYLGFLQTTFELSVLTTLICVALGYPFCYGLVVLRRGFAGVLFACVVCSFFASYLVRTYAWLILLQRRGIVNSFLMERGWIEEPLRFVYNFEGTLLGMVHILLPLLVMPLYASMRSVDRTLVNAAAALGASPTRAFRDVFLPLSLPGLVAGAVLVFIVSLGFYLTPAILGGGRIVVWATAVASAAEENPVWGAASALGIVLLVVTFALLYALKRLAGIKAFGRGAGR